MQIPIETTQDVTEGFIPEQMYRVRCNNVKYTEKNSSGNEMNTLACEIIEPETVEIAGRDVIVAGRQFQLFLVHNYEKQRGFGSQADVIAFHKKLRIPFSKDDSGAAVYDTKKAVEYYKGREFDIVLKSAEDIKRYSAGEHKGEPILDGEGKEISRGMRAQANIQDVPDNCRPTMNAEVAARPF